MNPKKEIRRLKEENIMLKLENLKLKLKIQELNSEWIHPRSCLHNSDPWPDLKP
jgi:regulator of replication initiation timing